MQTDGPTVGVDLGGTKIAAGVVDPKEENLPHGHLGPAPQPQLIVTFVDGNPYGTSHVDAQGNNPIGEQTRNAARHQAERVVLLTSAFKAGFAA
jgi:hypothetical protein